MNMSIGSSEKTAYGIIEDTADTLPAAPDNTGLKRLFVWIFVFGVCLACTGIAGKLCLSRFAKAAVEKTYIDLPGDTGFEETLNRGAGGYITRFVTLIIKNEPEECGEVLKELLTNVGEKTGLPSVGIDIANWLAGKFIQDRFPAVRALLRERAGVWWTPLHAAVYYRVLLIAGLIAAALSLLSLYLMGVRPRDIKKLKIRPALYAGAAWIVILVIVTGLFFGKMNSL